MNTTALQQSGIRNMSEGQAKGALSQLVSDLTRTENRAEVMKERAMTTAEYLLNTAEFQGAAFTGSLAEGYFGAHKLKVGPVDLRVAGGGLSIMAGLYNIMTGGKIGSHLVAAGNGLIVSKTCSLGLKAGQQIGKGGGGDTLQLNGPREVLLTPQNGPGHDGPPPGWRRAQVISNQ